MSNPRRQTLRKANLLFGGIFCITLLYAFLAQLTIAKDFTAKQPQQPPPKVKLGQLAPDFNLPLLTFDTDPAGKPIGKINDNNKIQLSDYFGKKPVCLIMSSYT